MTRSFLFSLLLSTVAAVSNALAADPFKLSVVPSSSTTQRGQIIYLAEGEPKKYHEFSVILTNISEQPQPVFEAWNSWGYDTVTFEITLPDGKKCHVTPGERVFTRNFLSTFLILPGESLVYHFQLDKQWKDRPTFDSKGQTPIKFVAIYQIYPSSDATTNGVWAGRVESRSYDFILNHF